jgi:hypothetical protein
MDEAGITKLQCVNHDCDKCKEQRTWVGLTDEEIWQWFKDNTALTSESGKRIYQAIEAKLKEKNT